MLSFIRSSLAKRGSSPTKIAEAAALGVPVLCNSGVGDVAEIVNELEIGMVVDLASTESVSRALTGYRKLADLDRIALRDRARPALGLEFAARQYRALYEALSDG
jgi:glycosyltransferase involved in cell wall biosynthesis